MQPYANLSGNSGVAEFEIGSGFIRIRFVNKSTIYTYDHTKPGQQHVSQMQSRAIAGRGLSTYIAKYIKGRYASKV